MKYILSPSIGLRSWQLVPCAFYIKGERNAHGLKREEFELLRRCDGRQELELTPLLQSLVHRRLCRPAREGDTLTPWQVMDCDNRYFPAMNWMITGRCNYNCLHCFNAADNARLQSEFTLEEAERLIEEAAACGINAFTITGGEPMLHPPLYGDSAKHLRPRNVCGGAEHQRLFPHPEHSGPDDRDRLLPLMKISLDGIGHHDWLRNRKGAEEDALRAIRLCVENGFRVKAQTNVHRLNLTSMLPTARLLDQMGVEEMRIIRPLTIAPPTTASAILLTIPPTDGFTPASAPS